jgi:glycosyltransferase involved in cell wall biosynthesis
VTALAGVGLVVAIGGLATTYLLFPAALVLLGRLRAGKIHPRNANGYEPRVSLIVTAFNEEDAIRPKLENTLGLDYPPEKLEVIVGSDASTDGTDAIVESYPDPRVRLVRNAKRGGKTDTTQRAVEAASGEVLIFSDATGIYNHEAIRELVGPLADARVGAVSGRVTWEFDRSETARGFRLYHHWVVPQRRAAPVSVSGSIHALRRDLFEVIPGNLSYDMVVPALAAMLGLRVVYANDAISREVSRRSARAEFAARLRDAVLAYAFLSWLWSRRRRIRERGYLPHLFMHKILRWFSPHLLLLLLVCHLALAAGGGVPALLLVPHLGVYALAGLLVRFEGRIRFPGSGALLLFATVNAGYAVGYVRWLRGADFSAWDTDRSAERHLRRSADDTPS